MKNMHLPNPLDYIDGKALGRRLRNGGSGSSLHITIHQGPPINIDAVAKGKAGKRKPPVGAGRFGRLMLMYHPDAGKMPHENVDDFGNVIPKKMPRNGQVDYSYAYKTGDHSKKLYRGPGAKYGQNQKF